MEKVTIEPLHAGYKLTVYPHRSLILTAEQLQSIGRWCLSHGEELEQEAQRWAQSPAPNNRISFDLRNDY